MGAIDSCFVTDEDLRGRNVLHLSTTVLLRVCSRIMKSSFSFGLTMGITVETYNTVRKCHSGEDGSQEASHPLAYPRPETSPSERQLL